MDNRTSQAKTSGAGDCAATDYAVEMTAQPDRPGIFLLTVTNSSRKTCELNGWAKVVGTDQSGASLTKVPTEQAEVPGPPTEVSLTPGKTAFAGVSIEQGDAGSSDTFMATGFRATMPGTNGSVNVKVIGTDGTNPEYYSIPVKSMKIGSLQPIAQSVTVF